jgi:hypothetical protein
LSKSVLRAGWLVVDALRRHDVIHWVGFAERMHTGLGKACLATHVMFCTVRICRTFFFFYNSVGTLHTADATHLDFVGGFGAYLETRTIMFCTACDLFKVHVAVGQAETGLRSGREVIQNL